MLLELSARRPLSKLLPQPEPAPAPFSCAGQAHLFEGALPVGIHFLFWDSMALYLCLSLPLRSYTCSPQEGAGRSSGVGRLQGSHPPVPADSSAFVCSKFGDLSSAFLSFFFFLRLHLLRAALDSQQNEEGGVEVSHVPRQRHSLPLVNIRHCMEHLLQLMGLD